MKKLFFLLLFTALFFLHGASPDLTNGVWYLSVPENKGKISHFEVAYKLKPDGSAEIIRSEKQLKQWNQMRQKYKEKTGKDFPEIKMSWKLDGSELHLILIAGDSSKKQLMTYLIGKNPAFLLPKEKKSLFILARKGAVMTPEESKQFFKAIKEAHQDNFAKNLKLPENIKLAEPEKNNGSFVFDMDWKKTPEDSFQKHVLSAIGKGEKLSDQAECTLPALKKLLSTPEGKDLLLRYLASNCEWRLYQEHPNTLHAVRYFRDQNGKIIPTLHQYYSSFHSDLSQRSQFRFEIGFSGKPWNSSLMHPRLKTERSKNTWETRFLCGGALVNIFDETSVPGRQMTKAALDWTDKEFSALLAAKEWKKLLPAGSIRKGKPDLILRDSYQWGIYAAEVWCNPGEKGSIYLKAFEITKGTPLSARRLAMASTCNPGWSDDPNEQFFSAMHFTIYEGEWEQFYGARFEIWFKPASGAPERKLFEKNYKIQGWSR